MVKIISEKINENNIIIQLFITILLNVICTIISLGINHIIDSEVPIVVLYLLSVLITSRYTKGYVYGMAASVLSMLSFNFFFTLPLYTLKVEDSSYYFTFFIMLLSSFFTSTFTFNLIRSKEIANEREKKSHILYSITSSLAKTSEVTDVAIVSAKSLSNLFKCDVTCIVFNLDNLDKLEKSMSQMLKYEFLNGEFTKTDIKTKEVDEIIKNYYSIPIKVRNDTISFICMPGKFKETINENKFLFDSIVMQITIAMERELLIKEKEKAKSEIENERFKNNLLRAISHDLRTPLTRITGASVMLNHNLRSDENIKLAEEIYEDSIWLTRLVENILNLTRIQEGRLTINMRPEAVEEIIGESIHRVSKYYPDHKILITVPDEVLFIPMDGKLIEQVLINLIENAIKHTSPSNEIKVSVWTENKKVWFEVYNNGDEIDKNDLPKLFDMFYVGRNSSVDIKRGMGLGLSICKSVINYHGGEIYAESNPSGGATFKFYLNI